MRGRWNTTRCPAPTRTVGGVIRCVIRRPCAHHPHWDRWTLALAIVWRIRPWWPNTLGRAQDRGLAHTPNVHPCRHCETEKRRTE